MLGTVINVTLHEMGHASAVLLAQSPLYTVEIGMGPTAARFKLGKFPFHIRWFPQSGIVMWGPNSFRHQKLQRAFVTLAGMMVTLSIFGLNFLVLNSMDLREDVHSSARWFVYLWAGITASTFLLMCGSWIPFWSQRDGRWFQTDALRLLSLPWMTRDEIYEAARTIQIRGHMQEMLDPDIKTADEAIANANRQPDDIKALFNACYHLHMAGNVKAMEFVRAALELPAPDSFTRGILLNFMITIGLDHNLLALQSKGRTWLEESYEMDRIGVGNLATYGAGLIDFNEDAEGMKILKDVIKRAKSPINLTYTHVFLAIGYKKTGEIKRARFHAGRAVKHFPQCYAIRRIIDLLPPQPEASKATYSELIRQEQADRN